MVHSEATAIDEVLAVTYGCEAGLGAVIVRLFNTVGSRQTGGCGMVIPHFCSPAVRGRPIAVYGTGDQTRRFCHVGDVVASMVALCGHPDACDKVFDIGVAVEISMTFAVRIIQQSGSASTVDLDEIIDIVIAEQRALAGRPQSLTPHHVGGNLL